MVVASAMVSRVLRVALPEEAWDLLEGLSASSGLSLGRLVGGLVLRGLGREEDEDTDEAPQPRPQPREPEPVQPPTLTDEEAAEEWQAYQDEAFWSGLLEPEWPPLERDGRGRLRPRARSKKLG